MNGVHRQQQQNCRPGGTADAFDNTEDTGVLVRGEPAGKHHKHQDDRVDEANTWFFTACGGGLQNQVAQRFIGADVVAKK